jgi:hypothetical protein
MLTASFDVRGSYPEPPDAKQTPVMRSLGCKFGSKYAGRSSLRPNISTMYRNKKKRKLTAKNSLDQKNRNELLVLKFFNYHLFCFSTYCN